MQNTGTPNTPVPFKSRFGLRLENGTDQASQKPAAEASACPSEEIDEDTSEDEDDLVKIEAGYKIAKEAATKATKVHKAAIKAAAEVKAAVDAKAKAETAAKKTG